MWDAELTQTWRSMEDAGHTEEALRMLERLLGTRPDDPDVLMLQSLSLRMLERDGESIGVLHRAVECGKDDPGILTRAASRYFFGGDLMRSRMCLDRARRLAPRDFPLRHDLKRLNRNLRRAEKTRESHERLADAFNADPTDREAAVGLIRSQMRTGRTYAPYYVVSRALLHHPDDRMLQRLERKLRRRVPAVERATAIEWARSGEASIAHFQAPKGPLEL